MRDHKTHKRDTSEVDPCLGAQSNAEGNFCSKWKKLILIAVILFTLLFVTVIGTLLFFLFRPAKKEQDIEYIHFEMQVPPADFDNIDDELIDTGSGPMYIPRPRLFYDQPKPRKLPHDQRELLWYSGATTYKTSRKPSAAVSHVSTRGVATTTSATAKSVITFSTTESSFENHPSASGSTYPSASSTPTLGNPSTPEALLTTETLRSTDIPRSTTSTGTTTTQHATTTAHTTTASPTRTTTPAMTTSLTATSTHTTTALRMTTSSPEHFEEVMAKDATQRRLILKSDDVRNDCSKHLDSGKGSGIYLIAPDGVAPFPAFCDQETNGGGWTVIQRRISGDVYFYNRTWNEYANGFGDLDGSHWLGLEKVYNLAPLTKGGWILRIELFGDHCSGRGCSGQSDGYWWAEWPFKLGDASQLYLLEIGKVISGNLTDENSEDFLQRNNGHPFTTIDRDNDDAGLNCAKFRHHGGWWHEKCGAVALNGVYGDVTPIHRYMVYAYQSLATGYSRKVIHPKKSVMMIKPNSAT